MKTVAILLIRLYQICIRPLIGDVCRFYPSCSNYTLEAIKTYGFFKGCFLGAKRIGKCHHLHPGGYDPVPEKKKKASPSIK